MYLPISRSLDFAAAVAVKIHADFSQMLRVFAVPAAVHTSYWWLESYLSAKANVAIYFPDWLGDVVFGATAGVVFTSIVRHLACGEKPDLFHRNLPWVPLIRNIAAITLLWVILGQVANWQYFETSYAAGDSGNWDAADFASTYVLLNILMFILHCAVMALAYPALARGTADDASSSGEFREHLISGFPGVFVAASLLTAATLMLQSLYWLAASKLAPSLVGAAQTTIEFWDVRVSLARNILFLPPDFIEMITPAVAAAVLVRGLRGTRHTGAGSMQ
jgi:hypothetical protein